MNYKITIILAVIVLVGCKGNDENMSPERVQLELLKGVWNLSGVEFDNGNISNEFTGFIIEINENGTYSTNSDLISRQPNPWPQNGIFHFNETSKGELEISHIIRDQQLDMEIQLTSVNLTITFVFDEAAHFGSGRTEAVNGEWVFSFTK